MTPPPLRVLFFGTPAFAVPTLDALLASRHQVVGIVTQPDRPRGRGHRTTDAPVKARAIEASVPVLQPVALKDPAFLSALSAFDADLGVVAAYGRILTDAVLAIPRLGLINVHASLLPKYRGAAPVHRAIMAGDSTTGITIMRVVKALDAGPTFGFTHRAIGPDETSSEVEHDLARLGAPLLLETVDRLALGEAREEPQDDASATYAPRITKDDSSIDWSRPARELHNQVRGLHPWPHAQSYVDGKRLIVLRSSVMPDLADAPPGTIVVAKGDDLAVATGTGALKILTLQLEGRKPMTAREFLAGHPLSSGRRLTSGR